jgi:hypothetical protein
MENKTGKYFKYAIGEIVLVVIGILIAVQVNSWYSKIKEDRLKHVYIENLINDLTKDTIQLNARVKVNVSYLKHIDSITKFVENPTTTLEDIKLLGKSKGITGLRTLNRYNVNTFNILVSTGDISLFEENLIQKIMELNGLQNFEINISEGNRNSYFEMYNSYLQKYISADRLNNTLTNEIWDNISAIEHASMYVNTIQIQKHNINRYIELSQNVLVKTEELLEIMQLNTKEQ